MRVRGELDGGLGQAGCGGSQPRGARPGVERRGCHALGAARIVAACAGRNCRPAVSARRVGAGGIRDAVRIRRIVDAPAR